MDYSAEVRRRFAAALSSARELPTSGTELASGAAEDRTLSVWARARIAVSGGRITGAIFDVWGCPDTIAAADLAAERMTGVSLADFQGLEVRRLAQELSIPTEKLGKLLRLEDAARAAVAEALNATEKGIENGRITD